MSASGLHGQKRRGAGEQSEQEVSRELKKIQEFQSLLQQVELARTANVASSADGSNDPIDTETDSDAQSDQNGWMRELSLVEEVLQLNPEFYTLWNRRRLLLSRAFDSDPHVQDALLKDKRNAGCKAELQFLDRLLQKAPKSYWLWNHRRWCLETFNTDRENANVLWKKELDAVNYMLNLDARNFHGWDYRRYILAKAPFKISTPMAEFLYTQEKIQQNFSNYSAWHYRSKLLPIVFSDPIALSKQLEKEVEFVRNAIFTEPADQSAWLYQRFIFKLLVSRHLDLAATGDHNTEQATRVREKKLEAIKEELAVIEELIDLEPDSKCKWEMCFNVFTRCRIVLTLYLFFPYLCNTGALLAKIYFIDLATKVDQKECIVPIQRSQDELDLLRRLQLLDPFREKYYSRLCTRPIN